MFVCDISLYMRLEDGFGKLIFKSCAKDAQASTSMHEYRTQKHNMTKAEWRQPHYPPGKYVAICGI